MVAGNTSTDANTAADVAGSIDAADHCFFGTDPDDWWDGEDPDDDPDDDAYDTNDPRMAILLTPGA